jgi:hypothetical protein
VTSRPGRSQDRDRPGRSQDRDRDPAGRARSSRPRDGLGRPLDRRAAGEPTIPDDLELTPAAALTLAQQLIDAGRPFHAHEVLEASWRAAPEGERDLWQGLAQAAVGLTHALRGNGRGAATLLRRGALRISGYAGAGLHEIDAALLSRAAGDLAARIEKNGLAQIAPAELRLRLRSGDDAGPGHSPGSSPGRE